MENNAPCMQFVLMTKVEAACILCLAFAGAVSIVVNVANGAYRLGKEEKEAEMRREFKKYMKKLKKKGGL